MNSIKSNIIDAINSIDDISMESTLEVYSALSSEYDKIVTFKEYLSDYINDDVYQEGEIMDKATGKYTADSTFMKIVKFIPRLFIAIIGAIGRVFTSDYKSHIDSTRMTDLESASDDEIEELSKNVERVSEGGIKIDKQKKKLTFGEKIGSIWNKGVLLMSIATCLSRIRTEIVKPNTDYKKFAGELKSIFNKEKKMDEETVAIGVDAFKKGLQDIATGSLAISAACKELSGILEKKCSEDSGKADDIKELVDQIQQVSSMVSKTTFLGRLGFKVIDVLGSDIAVTRAGKAKARSGVDKLASKALEKVTYADEYEELEDLDRDIKDKGRGISSKKTQNKKEAKLHKEKTKRRNTLDQLEAENLKADIDLAEGRHDRDLADEAYKVRRKVQENII